MPETKKPDKPIELNLFELVMRDSMIDFEIIKTYRKNLTTLKRGYLSGIGNMKCREVWRKFLEDSEQVMSQMSNQRAIIISAINQAKKKWEKEQQKQVTSKSSETSVPSAPEEKSISGAPRTSSVPAVAAPAENPSE